jgi:hypothetical protein
MIRQTSIPDGFQKTCPNTIWRWQDKVRESAVACDQMPEKEANTKPNKTQPITVVIFGKGMKKIGFHGN